ncbi:MAG: TPM domain-containing protein [Lewinella sp.]|nr:TPM domain-containing protein [Lewinella sp.]
MLAFFSPEDEQKIIAAIQDAERQTSGEIRVHLEDAPKHPTMEVAKRVFQRLGMHRTKARNGVLILIAPERRELAILGDQGINEVVPPDFWESEKDLMLSHFARGEYADGVAAAIQQVGEKLKAHFPYQTDDENELPDDISYGA